MREKIKRPNIGKVLKEKYGEDYFRNMGKKGGKAGRLAGRKEGFITPEEKIILKR